MHYSQCMAAMDLGKHMYIEKPLTHDIWEARKLTEMAANKKLVTQMGNQGGSNPLLEMVQGWVDSGKVGKISEVKVWTNRPVWPQGVKMPNPDASLKPDSLNWNLWLGPASEKPYTPNLHPFNWRGWWEYGTGALGDVGCHLIDVPFRTLGLKYPKDAECSVGSVYTKMWNADYYPQGCPPSSLITLKYIKKFNPTNVLIHDAARPNFSIKLLKNLLNSLKKYKASVPVISSTDSIKYKIKDQLFNLNRNNSYLTQTPQAFRFKDLYKLSSIQKNKIQDEASLFIENDIKIKFIKGENLNNKITFKEDIKKIKTYFGIGFDIHRLTKAKKLFLGGIKIPFHSGLKGHSDGDVILHSIIDALLGAMRKKDIGAFFPDNKSKFKNIRSPKMLKPIVDILNRNNFYINNLDINLICEKPKISKYRNKIINSLSNLLNLDKDLINLKGKTVEKLGLIGKEKAIACEVICSISK